MKREPDDASAAGLQNVIYLLRCADGSLYCGWTNHLARRVAAHNAGRGAKYTKPRRPVALAYWEAFDTKEEAMRREWQVKRLSHAEKEALIAGMKHASRGAQEPSVTHSGEEKEESNGHSNAPG